MSKTKTSQIPRYMLNQFVPIIVERVQEMMMEEGYQERKKAWMEEINYEERFGGK